MSKVISEPAATPDLPVRGEPLGDARARRPGVIVRVDGTMADAGVLGAEELERRLLELGFVEGARVEIVEQGLFGADPIAVKLDDMRVALRRHEAASLSIKLDGAA